MYENENELRFNDPLDTKMDHFWDTLPSQSFRLPQKKPI